MNDELDEILEKFMYSFTHLDDPYDLSQAKQAILALFTSELEKAKLEAIKDELHHIGASMLTDKGLMYVIARNQEIKDELSLTH